MVGRMPPPVPGISPRYRIEEEIGRGGMSVVYRAHDTALGRPVAVKVLHPHLQSQAEARLRLAREAQAVAKLQHPNIVEIFDYSGEDADTAYLVTECIHGETLEAMIQRRRLRLPETGALFAARVCEALAHAHALGVLHRDIKPGNVMIRDDGAVKLMDFGIAQVLDAQGLTLTGTLLGSPAHMSPEHIEGKPLDFRADVFSMGTVLYLLMVGELPFQGRNPHAVLKAILEGDYRPPHAANPRVCGELSRIVARSLERDPSRRYEGVAPLLVDLRTYLGDLGLHDIGGELGRFFADPDGYEEALGQRIVAARLRRGRESLERRRHAQALEDFNQVLALDPQNWEVMGLLARIGRRRAFRRAGALAAALVAATAVSWWLLARETEPEPQRHPEPARTAAPAPAPPVALSPPAPARPAPPVPPPVAAPARSAEPVQRPSPRGRAPRRLARLVRTPVALPTAAPAAPPEPAAEAKPPLESPAPAPEASRLEPPAPAGAPDPAPAEPPAPAPTPEPTLPVAPREVRINTWPKAVRIVVDGREVGWAGIVDRVQLLPGRHVIRLDSPSCHTVEREIIVPADGPVPPIVVRLSWKPGLLVVENPQTADVAVDGVYKGTSDRTLREPILVPIERGNTQGRVKVHVRISKPGHAREDRVEEIAAGRITRVRVSLKPL
jgi:serine/threonine-protein kinase